MLFELRDESIIGIDLAADPKNPTCWASLKQKRVRTKLLHTDKDILRETLPAKPALVAIDAPLSMPRCGKARTADREMMHRCYRVFPPLFSTMRHLTDGAIGLNKLIAERGYKTIEVHPTSTRKALKMPIKATCKVQAILKTIGLKGEIESRMLTVHEIDATIAALTAHIHTQGRTEAIGDEEEGYIIIPKQQEWRTIRV